MSLTSSLRPAPARSDQCSRSAGSPPGSSMSLPWAICHRLSSRCWSCASCAAACQQVRTRSLPSLAAHLPSEQQIAAAQQRWWGADYPRISRQFMVAAPLRVLESFSSVLGSWTQASVLIQHHHYSPELTPPRHSPAFSLLQRTPSCSCMTEGVWVMLVCAMHSVCVHLAVVWDIRSSCLYNIMLI
jgi:hypothetical protein